MVISHFFIFFSRYGQDPYENPYHQPDPEREPYDVYLSNHWMAYMDLDPNDDPAFTDPYRNPNDFYFPYGAHWKPYMKYVRMPYYIMQDILNWIKKTLQKIKATITNEKMYVGLKIIYTGMKLISKGLIKVKTGAVIILQGFQDILHIGFKGVWDKISEGLKEIGTGIGNIVGAIEETIQAGIEEIVKGVQEIIQGGLEGIKEAIDKILGEIGDIIQGVKDWVEGLLGNPENGEKENETKNEVPDQVPVPNGVAVANNAFTVLCENLFFTLKILVIVCVIIPIIFEISCLILSDSDFFLTLIRLICFTN